MKESGFHIRINGLVQGVGYRYHCSAAAKVYGVRGYVKNLDDGAVELEVFGEPRKVDTFIVEITRTDRGFNVTEIIKDEIPANKEYKGFTIKF